MSREELRTTLATLHSTLSETSDVDDETRKLLTTLTDDIHRLLDDHESDPEGDHDSASERVTDMMREFDANHPIIGGLVQRLSDGLANMGI